MKWSDASISSIREKAVEHWKAKKLDLTAMLHMPDVPAHVEKHHTQNQQHGLHKALDNKLIELAKDAIEHKKPGGVFQLPIRNVNRTGGTMLGSEVTRYHGGEGLPEDTIRIFVHRVGGPELRGICCRRHHHDSRRRRQRLTSARDFPAESWWCIRPEARIPAEDNIIIGNVALYGATGGKLYSRSRRRTVCRSQQRCDCSVEGVGDHGCEYMTRGHVVVLGRTGRNFAAGMSGGIAYVLDQDGDFAERCNLGMVDLEPFADAEEEHLVHSLIEEHAKLTGSERARIVVGEWSRYKRPDH
jgi:glutamate synthase domain-containing protein 3